MTQAIDDKGINVALETILEFDGKERAVDMKFLDKMQTFLKNVEKTIEGRNRKYVLRSKKSKKRKTKYTSGKLRKATTKPMAPMGLNFTDFFIHLVGVLRSFDKPEVYLIFKTIEEEIKKRHNSECKVHELLENPTIRRSIDNGLQSINESPLQILEEIVNEFSLNPDNNGPFRIKEQVPKWSAKFFNWLEKFYTDNSPTSEQFFEVINSLDRYSNSKQSLRENEIKNEIVREDVQGTGYLHDAAKLIDIVKKGLRSLFFDQYSNLDPDKRKVVQIRLQSYWMNPDNDKDAIASGYDNANLGEDGFLTSRTTEKLRSKKHYLTTTEAVRSWRSTTKSSLSSDEKFIPLYDDKHKQRKRKIKRHKNKSEERSKRHKVKHNSSKASGDETTEKNKKKKATKRKKKQKHVSKEVKTLDEIKNKNANLLDSLRFLLSLNPESISNEKVISQIKDFRQKVGKTSKSAEDLDWKTSLLNALKRRSSKLKRTSDKKDFKPQGKAKKRFKIANRPHDTKSSKSKEGKSAKTDHSSSKVISISSSIEDSTSGPHRTQIIEVRKNIYRKHNMEKDNLDKTSKAWRVQVIEEHTATIDILKKKGHNSSEEIIRFPKTKLKLTARPVQQHQAHNKSDTKPNTVLPASKQQTTTVKVALAINAELERDEQQVVKILEEIGKENTLKASKHETSGTSVKVTVNKQPATLSVESQALFNAVENLGRTHTKENVTKSPHEEIVTKSPREEIVTKSTHEENVTKRPREEIDTKSAREKMVDSLKTNLETVLKQM